MRLLACYSRCMMTLDAVGGGSNKESEMRGLVFAVGCVFLCAGCATVTEHSFEDPFEGTLSEGDLSEASWSPLDKSEEEPPADLLVDVECAFIELNDADARPLLSDGLSAKMILDLVKQGKATVLAAPLVRSESGHDAESKMVEEYIYPSEFDITPVSSKVAPTGLSAVIKGLSVEPGSFETREVGAILQVTPDLDATEESILLHMSPELVLPPLWRDYGYEVVEKSGDVAKVKIEQPFFRTVRVTVSLVLRDGESALIGGGAVNPASGRPIYLVVTAKIVKR